MKNIRRTSGKIAIPILILVLVVSTLATLSLDVKLAKAAPVTIVLNYNQTILTEGTTWTVPDDWTDGDNTIEVIGGGGAGHTDTTGAAGAGGGGGGGYSMITNLDLTPGATVTYQIGVGGKNGSVNGGATFFNRTAGSAGTCADTVSVCANGGTGATSATGGAGGSTTGADGTTLWAGGTGGNGNTTSDAAGGGGGAGGPSANGRAGGSARTTSAAAGDGGGGGGGNGGSSSSVGSTGSATGGAGGNGDLGSGAGTGGSTASGGSGSTSGAGGGGGDSALHGGHGAAGTNLGGGVGPGGGGGGAGDTSTTVGLGGHGGLYGAGGGGGRYGGRGAPGVIVITYNGKTPTRTSWTVPDDWDSSNNTIEVIGGGGSAFSAAQGSGTGGGGGGGYSRITNLSLTPGATVTYQIGQGGRKTVVAPGAGVNGGATFFNRTAGSAGTCADTVSVCANGGTGATSATGGAGGSTTGADGTTLRAGGAGGTGNGTGDSGGGGGGAGGFAQNGLAGGAGGTSASIGGGGGGGAGDDSGANSTVGESGNTAATTGGDGGMGPLGTGGGAGGTGAGAAGTSGTGGGGAGGWQQNNGGDGGSGSATTYGGGGGGGVGDNNVAITGALQGGDGGLFGAGGGGGLSPGFGANGVIVITYEPLVAAAPTVTTQAESSVTQTTTTVNGNITATGGATPTVRGFAWGTNSALSGGDTATTTENGSFSTGAFTGSLSSLTCNTTYYSRPYATNSAGTGYGTIDSFTTSPCTPTVTTQAESDLTQTSATVNGNITSTGGSNATVRGFAWGTNSTLSNGDTATTTENGSFSTGAFTGSLSSLTCNTTYYSRPYATNPGGTGYGTIDSFTTSPCSPTVTTQAASSVAASSATANGNITATGGADATVRGFAWGTVSNLSAGDTATTTENGTFGTGAFTGSLTSLTGNTTYYTRAYATNTSGTGIGTSIQSFLTLPGTPGTPAGGSITATTLTVSWTAPTGGAASYKVERCTGSGCSDFSEIATGVTDLFYAQTGLSAATTYRYRVRATNATGDGAYATSNDITTSATATFELSAWRFFDASTSVTPGTALDAQDTAVTLGATGADFRMRILMHAGTSNVAQSERSFKLQFASRSGTCDSSFSGETYADITTNTGISYYDTAGISDNSALGAQADLTHGADTIVNQTYEEANNFSNSQSSIASGQDGKWDFSLYDNGGVAGETYCIRVVNSDDSVLDTYPSALPEVSIPAGSPDLTQTDYRFRNDDGTEETATWKLAVNTPVTSDLFTGDRLRLRFLISNVGAGSAAGYTYRLEHSSSSCSVWVAVPSTSSLANEHWVMDSTTYASNGSATTDSAGISNPGGKTFTAGFLQTSTNQTSAHTLTSTQFTEHEYSIRSTNNASTGVVYCFRVTNAGSTNLFTYSNQPQITLSSTALRPQGGGGGGSSGAGGEGSGSGDAQSGGNQGGGGADQGGAGGESQSGGGESQGGGNQGGGGGGDTGYLNNGVKPLLANVLNAGDSVMKTIVSIKNIILSYLW